MVALEYASNLSGLLDLIIGIGGAGLVFFSVKKGFLKAAEKKAIEVEKKVFSIEDDNSIASKLKQYHGFFERWNQRIENRNNEIMERLNKLERIISYIKGKGGFDITDV